MKEIIITSDLSDGRKSKISIHYEDRWDDAVWKIEDVFVREKGGENFRSLKKEAEQTWQWKRLTSKDRDSFLMYTYEQEVGKETIMRAAKRAWERLKPGVIDIVAN